MRFFLIFLIFFSLNCAAQKNTRLDSLLNASKTDKGRTLVHAFNEISWEFKNSNADSALYYGRKALKVAKSINDKQAIASAYNSIASSYEALSELDNALDFHKKSLEIKKQINDTIGIANTYNNLGIVYDTKGNYTNALQNYFDALRIYEEYADEFQKVPMVYVNIGIVYKKQKEYAKVLEYYKKALQIYKDNNYFVGEAITTGNVGSVLLNLNKYDESIKYSLRAEKLYDSLGYTRYVPYMRINIAIAKDSLKQYKKAQMDYLTSIADFTEDKNLYELSNAKVNLARNYRLSGDFKKSKTQLEEALRIIKENEYKEMEIKALNELSAVYSQTMNFEKAYTYLKQYTIEKDSVFQTEKTKAIFELEAKFESEKKEKEILSQRADLAEKELDISKKNNYILGLIALAVVLCLLAYLIYNQQKLKNRQLQKENALKDALVKIETQNKLQEQRLRISRDLHDNIGAQLTFIISSLDNLKYGFKIPSKLSDKLKSISLFTTSTIYELRDTIWAMNKDEITFEDLKIRISNFIEKANSADQNIDFEFKVGESVKKPKSLSSVKGMNIYRIIQEAINNAMKYAEASQISVSIDQVGQKLNIAIVDNGKGFDMTNSRMGNGLNNMKKRSEEIGGELQISSNVNEGTRIELTL